MQSIQLALVILGIVALIESLIILIFPHASHKLAFKMTKNPNLMKKIGVIEFLAALALILTAALFF